MPTAPDPRTTDWREWLAYGLAWADLARMAPATTPARAVAAWSATSPEALALTMHSYREDRPGPRWQALASATWPGYRRWFHAQGAAARPGLAQCREAVTRYLPELLPTWERLTDLAVAATGSDRDEAGRLLSLWCATPFVSGCSQVALPGSDPTLIRSYDYDPKLFEGVVASTNYSGARRVIGTSDCLWGLLDGMNEDGLAISLTYGGRGDVGEGFGIPIVVRCLLETCGSVAEAVDRLRGIPIAQCYNLTFLDRGGDHATVFVGPGGEFEASRQQVATNHRLDRVENEHTARALRSVERHTALAQLVEAGCSSRELAESFVRAPIRTTHYAAGFGSLYAAAYRPAQGCVEYLWPGRQWRLGFTDPDQVITVEVDVDPPPQPRRDRAAHGRARRRPGTRCHRFS